MLASMSEVPEPAPTPEVEPDASPAAESRPERRRRPRGLWIGVGVAAVLVVGAAIAIPVSIANAQAAEKAAAEKAAAEAELDRLAMFASAFNTCNFPASEYVDILDAGEAVSFTRVGKLIGPDLDDVYCVLGEVGAPSTIESKIGATRALDGVQTDEWAGFDIEWRYHPDDGATILVEHAK